jgi:hydroxymethylglutaryl-CoA reductase (NADPH)
MNAGLKNRGKTRADIEERRKAVEEYTQVKLASIASYTIDPIFANKNIENMIGTTQVPLGYAGPIRVNGHHAHGEFIVPLATTEGALLATVNRGCTALTEAGGVNTLILKDQMTRAPVFRVDDIHHGKKVADWIEEHLDDLKGTVSATDKFLKLLSATPFSNGRSLFVRLAYDTGDAMGMNMATIATEAVGKVIQDKTGAVLISVSGNLCVDKKPSAVDYLMGRGKTVLADAILPSSVVEDRLKADPNDVVEACYRKNLIGSALALSYGYNAHMANMLAAIYIATGQDPAQVVEGSMGSTTCEIVKGGLYVSVRIPAMEVGTIGGGTRLPCQSEALSMIGCLGAGKAKKFTEIVASVVLAGELSTIAAQASGHLTSAHVALGR